MQPNRGESGHPHSRDKLCRAGKDLYTHALRVGRVARSQVETAVCLIDFGLLRPDPDDSDWMRPVPPSIALNHLMRPIEQEIQERRRQTINLIDAFEPFMGITAQAPPSTNSVSVLEGLDAINSALDQATSVCQKELLTVQPGSVRSLSSMQEALRRVTPLLDQGIQMRTLYQHTARHHPATIAYVEHVGSSVEVRTIEEIIDRLIIVDRKVAFIPARSDRRAALELRQPGLVEYLVGVFEQFWLHAVPWEEQISYAPELDGINSIQRSIAALLVEGHVDDSIARRLGMNVRTCRGHIAKLSAALGSGSRAQLGYLIAQSGILEQDHRHDDAPH
ncbi:helix-turn-helix transcriptional regulator [Streptomyces sp. NPDC050504]|uniref:helix-turn-helix transcriptional regulator n=1 Tax=Streptomyces sp. NPDC050504 TaxID=3365618 RepID=UPI00379D0EC2